MMTHTIKRQTLQVINKIIFKEKKKVIRFKDIALFPSEIHLMLVIKNHIDTNTTEIAKQLGLTKGAISQTLSRLEKKGIIIKRKDPYKKNELTLSLTDAGKEAYEFCQAVQTSFAESLERFLCALDDKEKEVVFNFLLNLEKTIDGLD